jgi:hypothetical protein
MVEFIKTFLIAVIPSFIAGLSAYLAARNKSKTQIKVITEQNKADIEKLVEQHKIDIDALKEKHKLELESKEKDHTHQMELIKLQHNNELAKSEETMKNQLAMNTLGGLLGGMFSENSDTTKQMSEMMQKSLFEAMLKQK